MRSLNEAPSRPSTSILLGIHISCLHTSIEHGAKNFGHVNHHDDSISSSKIGETCRKSYAEESRRATSGSIDEVPN